MDKKEGKKEVASATIAFNERFKRQAQEVQGAAQRTEAETRLRHSLILKTMTESRRALMEVAKVDLGSAFEFALEVDDWQGWPRVNVRLVNIDKPHLQYPSFTVSAHERAQTATIEIYAGDSMQPISYNITNEDAQSRFVTVLKRAVRLYLDEVSNCVLSSSTNTHEEFETECIQLDSLDEQENRGALKADDFFVQTLPDDLFDKVDSEDELDRIDKED